MKQIKFFAMALAALSMFSCSKEESNETNIPGKAGEPAYAQFSIRLPEGTSAAGRAVTDGTNTGLASESAIVDAAVYIVSNGKIEKVLPLTKQVDIWKSASTEITTGTKMILAVVNGGGVYAQNFTEGAALSTIDAARIAATTNASSATNVLFTSKLISKMIEKTAGSGDASTTPVKFEIPVDRAVAKIVVRDGISVKAGLPVKYEKTVGTSARFAVNGMTVNVGLYQRSAGSIPANVSDVKFPNWKTTPKSADYKVLAEPNADLSTISGMGTETAAADHGGLYAMENVISAGTLNKESTILYLKVQLTPTSPYTLANNTAGIAISKGAPYLLVKHKTDATSYLFFADATVFGNWKTANAALAANYEATGTLYPNGENYYAVRIRHDEANPAIKYSVLRNTIYDITIGTVNAFGGNGDNTIVDPDKPIEENAFIEATIKINDWATKKQSSDLN